MSEIDNDREESPIDEFRSVETATPIWLAMEHADKDRLLINPNADASDDSFIQLDSPISPEFAIRA